MFAAVLTVIRAAAVRVQWARLGLDTVILLLGFGAFFWYCVIAPTAAAQHDPDLLKYVLAQSYIALNCITLLACGVLLSFARTLPQPALAAPSALRIAHLWTGPHSPAVRRSTP